MEAENKGEPLLQATRSASVIQLSFDTSLDYLGGQASPDKHRDMVILFISKLSCRYCLTRRSQH
jgi:hypothetical protein